MELDEELLRLLRCPVSREPLRLSEDGRWLICDAARLRYPVLEGIPRLTAEAAEKLEETS